MNVLVKTEKISLAGCVESTVIMYAGFFFTCRNMLLVCGNLDTQQSWGICIICILRFYWFVCTKKTPSFAFADVSSALVFIVIEFCCIEYFLLTGD